MTPRTDGPRAPGRMLLKIAPRLFNERFMSAVVCPTIADLQFECAAARASRVKRFRALCRGYCAFWMLTLAAPFAGWAIPAGANGAIDPSAVGRVAIASTILALLVTRPAIGFLVVIVASAGAVFAVLIHAWYERHPSDIPAPDEAAWRQPQINFSSTDVAGNVGGLIFVVGSVLIVSIGLPWVLWFLLAGSIAACFVAWRLIAWRTSHPNRGLPENLIVLR